MHKHIVIAEDEHIIANMMAAVLRKANVRVTIANNGREALSVMEKEEPDLLVLDLLMPVMDGHELMKIMMKKKIQCPVIVVTNVDDQKKCKDFEVTDYFVKSDMDDDALWTVIENVLFPASPQTV